MTSQVANPPVQSIRLLFSALLLVMLLSAPGPTLFSTTLPTSVGALGGLATPPWLLTASTLSSTIAVPPSGTFADLLGRTTRLSVPTGLFLVCSPPLALASHLPQPFLRA
ncbi:EmrB/QacA family drug resistance transporter, partial [Klebsiella pneumoniae]